MKILLQTLIESALKLKKRMLLCFETPKMLHDIDKYLWEFSETSFFAHGCDTDEGAEHLPIVLTLHNKNINKAHICFFLGNIKEQSPQDYERIVFIFEDHDIAQKDYAREQWNKYKKEYKNIFYYKETEDKRWIKGA